MTDFALMHPDLQPLCRELLAQAGNARLVVRVTQVWRSPQKQAELYAQGRTAPGPIVTNAPPGTSKHEFTINGQPASKAFDFAIIDNTGQLIRDGMDHRYTQVGEFGEGVGLSWGGRWKHPDFDHFEIT